MLLCVFVWCLLHSAGAAARAEACSTAGTTVVLTSTKPSPWLITNKGLQTSFFFLEWSGKRIADLFHTHKQKKTKENKRKQTNKTSNTNKTKQNKTKQNKNKNKQNKQKKETIQTKQNKTASKQTNKQHKQTITNNNKQ